MSELPPRTAALLEAARRDHNPNQTDRERVHAALFGALSLPLSLPETSGNGAMQPPRPLSPQPAPAASSLGGLGVKLALVVSVSLGGVGWWTLGSVPAHKGESDHASATASSPSARIAPAGPRKRTLVESTPEAPIAPTAQPAAALPAAESTRDPKLAQRVRFEPGHKRNAHASGVSKADETSARGLQAAEAPSSESPASSPAVSEPSLAAQLPQAATPTPSAAAPSAFGELVLIRRALSALRAGSPESALRALAEHRTSYPTGAMLSEREGLYALALCESGQIEAGLRQKAEFLRTFANSPIAARVKAACQGTSR
jgi:hypothetical protein